MTTSVTSQRKKLGELVREARLTKGLNQTQLGELIGCKQAKINKIETTLMKIRPGDVDAIIRVLGIEPDLAGQLKTLVRATQQVESWSDDRKMVPAWFREFLDAERQASRIHSWTGERIPGVLQSEPYMLAVYGRPGHSKITSHVKNRAERKLLFELESPPDYHFIFSASAFHRQAGGSVQVMIDEITYLLDLDDLYPWISLHILPFNAPIGYAPPDFTLMSFDGKMKDFAFTETLTKGEYHKKPEVRQVYEKTWEDLSRMALDQRDSREFLEAMLHTYREA